MKTFPTLYKRDSKGKLREWRMEVDGDSYRTVAGLADGQQVTSTWKKAHPKNTGKANATTGEEQAIAEVEALYTKRLDGEYHRDAANIDEARFFKPMLAAKWEDRMNKVKYPVFVQPKLDGIRCLASRDGLFSRTGKEIVAVPHIWESLAPLFEANPDLVLDGELYNHELKADFNQIVSLVRKTKPTAEDIAESAQKVEYHVYDMPSHDGKFGERFSALTFVDCDHVVLVDTQKLFDQEQVDALYITHMADGYEGGIIREDAQYEQKRSKHLLKRKDFEDDEFEIIRIEEGQGNWSGYAKRVVFRNDLDGREVGAGLAANQELAKQLLEEADEYVGKQVTIRFFTRTPDGVPRFPIAKVLHKDARW